MKKEIEPVSATPSKRIYLSIIADYDLNRSICELTDNALDIWKKNDISNPINISIKLDIDQQVIYFEDNAGGIKKAELSIIISPGKTKNEPEEESIGFFGVGTKRAVIALSQDIKIKTRYKNENTHQIEIDDDWLGIDDWYIQAYQVDNITKSTTIIELKKLRIKITENLIENLKTHLGSTYSNFLKNENFIIKVNNSDIKPITFNNWAYPPNFSPRRYTGNIKTKDGDMVKVEVIAGLTTKSSPAKGEYGVYFYFNERLIIKELKNYEVGFIKGLAGQPHAQISLIRVVVKLSGQARSMPWNSSKSNINPNHPVFLSIQKWLVQVVKDYASLSRRWMGDWPNKVFKYKTGTIIDVEIDNFPEAKKSYLPPLPKIKHSYQDKISQSNKKIVTNKPWTKGLYEVIIAVDTISRKKLEQKNRINLILLDSTLEIAFKEYLVNDSGIHYSDDRLKRIFKQRNLVHDEIKIYVRFSDSIWRKINYYYGKRCDLIHKRASAGISDHEIENYRELVEKVLKKLFKLKFDSS